jgi:anti-sigma B factor antagonist
MKLIVTRKKHRDGSVSLRLDGEFNIYTVRKLKGLFMQHLDGAGSLELDLAGITRFDSAGYQLLEHAEREARRRSKPFMLGRKSDEVLRLYALYGKQAC